MGLVSVGPNYGGIRIKDSLSDKPDGWWWYAQLSKLFLGFIGIVIGATFVIGIALKFIGPIVVCGVIGLLLWCCNRYGTNRSVFDRFRYRTTKAQRERIQRRLSDARKPEKNCLSGLISCWYML